MTLSRNLAYALWVLCPLIALMSLRFLALPMAEAMPHMAHYLPDLPLPLFAHLVLGPLALLLVPFQFWAGLRSRHARWHRATGYAYVLSVLGAGMGAVAMLPQFLGSTWAAAGFALLSGLWLVTTFLALAAARRRDFRRHRLWMLRSAALTLAAVSLRLIMPFLMAAGWSVVETYDITAWASWLFNLAALELWLYRKTRARA